jgi:uncharacterized protein YqhQ
MKKSMKIKDFFKNVLLVPVGCLAIIMQSSIVIFIGVLIARFFCNIDPNETYTWYSGIWHGIFVIPNFILSLFGNTICKAENYTTMYNIFWWITFISTILGGIGGRMKE